MQRIRQAAVSQRLCVVIAQIGFRMLGNLRSRASSGILLGEIQHPQHILKDPLLLPYCTGTSSPAQLQQQLCLSAPLKRIGQGTELRHTDGIRIGEELLKVFFTAGVYGITLGLNPFAYGVKMQPYEGGRFLAGLNRVVVAVRQKKQGMPGGYGPLFMLFANEQTALFHNQQIEFPHTCAARMLIPRLIDGTVAFQEIRKWRGRQMNIGWIKWHAALLLVLFYINLLHSSFSVKLYKNRVASDPVFYLFYRL
ncbi:hypothetical protein D3C75_769000 [compost metagenome]